MKRKLGGLILGTWIVGAALAPAAWADQACYGTRIELICPFGTAFSDDHACISKYGTYVDYDNCIRPD